MKNLMKMCIAAVLAFTMIISLGTVGFAANADGVTSNVLSSKVEFVVDGTSISARAFVRNYTGTETATLILAAYEGDDLIAAKSVSGINKVLKTDAVTIGDDTVVKAYVWENGSKKVITEIANYSKALEDVCAGLEVTVGSTKLKASDFDSTYTYEMDYSTLDEVTLPVVTAEIADNGADVKVETDADALETTITVSYGEKTSSTATVPNYTQTITRYGKAQTRVYTIKYKVREAAEAERDSSKIYYDEVDYTDDTSVYTDSERYAGTYDFKYTASKSYTVEENKWKKVTIKLADTKNSTETNASGTLYQTTAIIVKPADDADKGSVIVAPVTSEGEVTGVTALTQTDDKYFRTGITTNTDGNYTGNVYTKKSSETPVSVANVYYSNSTVTTVTSQTDSLYVSYNLAGHGDADDYASGSRFLNNRHWLDSNTGKAFYTVPESLAGCEHIALNDGSRPVTNEITFYIAKSATVYVYSSTNASNKTVAFDDDDASTWTLAASGTYPTIGYQNRYNKSKLTNTDYWTLFEAWLIANGGVSGRDYEISGDYLGFSNFYFMQSVGTYLFEFKLLDSDGSAITDLSTDTRLYDNGSLKDVNTLAALFTPVPEDITAATVTEAAKDSLISDLTLNTTVTYTSKADVKYFDVDEITGTGVGSYRVHPDRNNQVGHVTQYPAVLELYGNENIRGSIGWVNDSTRFDANSGKGDKDGDGTFTAAEIAAYDSALRTESGASADDYDYTDGSKYYKAKYTEDKIKNWTLQPDGVYYMNPYCYYWRAANGAIYTFTAAEDVEVLVFSSNTGYKAMLDAVEIADGSNWVSMNYSESDCVKIYQASAMAFTNIAGRKVNKGETVTIYSPGKYSSHYLVFVRPIN